MAQAARDIRAAAADPVPSPAPGVAAAQPIGAGDVAWAPSPARLLHDRLVATFVAPPAPDSEPRLSARARMGLVIGVSAALWTLIGLGVAALR